METENKIKYYILAIYKDVDGAPDFVGIEANCPAACFELPEIKNLPENTKYRIKEATRKQFYDFKKAYDAERENQKAYLKEIEKKRTKLEKDGCRVIIVDNGTMYGIK